MFRYIILSGFYFIVIDKHIKAFVNILKNNDKFFVVNIYVSADELQIKLARLGYDVSKSQVNTIIQHMNLEDRDDTDKLSCVE